MHFGLRGPQEHNDMKVEDFSFQKDDVGDEFVTFPEGQRQVVVDCELNLGWQLLKCLRPARRDVPLLF